MYYFGSGLKWESNFNGVETAYVNWIVWNHPGVLVIWKEEVV